MDDIDKLREMGFGEPQCGRAANLPDHLKVPDMETVRVYFPAEEPEALALCEGGKGVAALMVVPADWMTEEGIEHDLSEELKAQAAGTCLDAVQPVQL